MTAFRATSSCFICPTPARAFHALITFDCRTHLFFAAKILLFSHISKIFFFSIYFCHYFAIPQTESLFLKRGPRKFAICGESGGISRLNVATRQSCDLLPNAHLRWLLRSACPSRPDLCQLPAVQHNTSGGVARYPARSVFEYTLFCIFCINILAYIEKNPYLCSRLIGRLFGTTFRGFLVGVLFDLGDEA